MTPLEQMEAVLADLETWARHVLANPRNGPAREELRRACNRAAALRKQEAAARAIEEARPGSPPPDLEPDATAPDQPAYRLPYRDD